LVWNRLESKAWGERVGGTLEPAHYLDVARSGHVDGCRALDLGCSRKRAIVPLLGLVSIGSPWRIWCWCFGWMGLKSVSRSFLSSTLTSLTLANAGPSGVINILTSTVDASVSSDVISMRFVYKKLFVGGKALCSTSEEKILCVGSDWTTARVFQDCLIGIVVKLIIHSLVEESKSMDKCDGFFRIPIIDGVVRYEARYSTRTAAGFQRKVRKKIERLYEEAQVEDDPKSVDVQKGNRLSV
jgi:hypothetical protein